MQASEMGPQAGSRRLPLSHPQRLLLAATMVLGPKAWRQSSLLPGHSLSGAVAGTWHLTGDPGAQDGHPGPTAHPEATALGVPF